VVDAVFIDGHRDFQAVCDQICVGLARQNGANAAAAGKTHLRIAANGKALSSRVTGRSLIPSSENTYAKLPYPDRRFG
jgi:hypothetical protein